MLAEDINIRDPFILSENGKYYLYGTRATRIGYDTGGFDVYISDDMSVWSEPVPCFDSAKYGLNRQANWAPEVHKYKGGYYMFATFTKEDGLRGTYILRAESPLGPFVPHSNGAVTPEGWAALDGTLYIENGVPYIVFCHEEVQIKDGTICFQQLKEDLTCAIGEPKLLFAASEAEWGGRRVRGEYKVTDGPFMWKSENGTLFMLWSTFVDGKYAECTVKFTEGSVFGALEHTGLILDNGGGHGMIFKAGEDTFLTFHSPNNPGDERVRIVKVAVTDKGIKVAD